MCVYESLRKPEYLGRTQATTEEETHKMHTGVIVSVNACLSLFRSPVIDWRPAQGAPRAPAFPWPWFGIYVYVKHPYSPKISVKPADYVATFYKGIR